MDDQIEDPKKLFLLWTQQTQEDSSYYLFV